MIHPYKDSGYGDLLGDLAAQAEAAHNRNVQPADPVEFIKWVQETTREQSDAYDKLKKRYEALSHSADLATIGLKRLESLILLSQRPALETLQAMHRDFTRANGGIAYTLDQTKATIRELITNYQMVAESLRSNLADRFKKIGIQKDLGLRLQDLDESLKRSDVAVTQQEKINRQLSDGIQDLLSKTGVKLSPVAKENIAKEDEVRRIALNLKKKIESNVDPVNYTRQPKPKPVDMVTPILDQINKGSMSGMGDDTSTASQSISFAPAVTALVVGAIVGVLLIYRSKL